jgi:hypothetical protein
LLTGLEKEKSIGKENRSDEDGSNAVGDETESNNDSCKITPRENIEHYLKPEPRNMMALKESMVTNEASRSGLGKAS